MSSDNQYTALGPAAVGFQTYSTDIDRGAEIAGNTFGVRAEGRQDGVIGRGREGRGGRFESGELCAQVNLHPQRMKATRAQAAHPLELVQPQLPLAAEQGDLWMTAIQHARPAPAALWLCVASGRDRERPAQWCQVLLGAAHAGTQRPLD